MTTLEKIKNLTWWNEITKLKDILTSFNTSTESIDVRVTAIEDNPVESTPQDLKSVVDVSGYAWKDEEFNYISLLNGSAYNRTISWDLNNSTGKNSSLTFDSGNLLIDSKTTTFGMQLRSTEGRFSVTQHTDDIFIKSTLNLAVPTVSSVISVTAPTVAGNYRIPVEPQNTYTVATLPTAVLGATAVVTDATTPTYLGTLVGGGAVVCPVWYNGTSWKSR